MGEPRTVNDIAAFLRGPVHAHGSGCLATADAWATRYERDVAFLLGALSEKGVDITPTDAAPTPVEPERHTWDHWEEMLGLTIISGHALDSAFPNIDALLTRREFLEGYMTCVEAGRVDHRRPGHQNLMAEMKAIAMEGVPT